MGIGLYPAKKFYYLNKHESDDGVVSSLLMVLLEAARQQASDGGLSFYRGYCVAVGVMGGISDILSSVILSNS